MGLFLTSLLASLANVCEMRKGAEVTKKMVPEYVYNINADLHNVFLAFLQNLAPSTQVQKTY